MNASKSSCSVKARSSSSSFFSCFSTSDWLNAQAGLLLALPFALPAYRQSMHTLNFIYDSTRMCTRAHAHTYTHKRAQRHMHTSDARTQARHYASSYATANQLCLPFSLQKAKAKTELKTPCTSWTEQAVMVLQSYAGPGQMTFRGST